MSLLDSDILLGSPPLLMKNKEGGPPNYNSSIQGEHDSELERKALQLRTLLNKGMNAKIIRKRELNVEVEENDTWRTMNAEQSKKNDEQEGNNPPKTEKRAQKKEPR